MIAVIGAVAMISLLVTAALAATNSDQRLTMRDLDQKRAYAAAQSGIADYSYHLNNDNGYWARCTDVPTPNAINQKGSTANRRPVPGRRRQLRDRADPGHRHSSCNPSNPGGSMLESNGQNIGTFRIRSTGYRRATTERPRSWRPTSRPASSTTSTSPSSRPPIRSPTGSRTPRRP